MSEIRTVTTLRRKWDEISASIRLYENKLEQARADLAHVTAAVRIFAATDRPQDIPRYVDSYRLFKRGEPWANLRRCECDGVGFDSPGLYSGHATPQGSGSEDKCRDVGQTIDEPPAG